MDKEPVVQPVTLKHKVNFLDTETAKEEMFVLSYTQSNDRYNRFDIRVNGFISGTMLDFNNPTVNFEKMQAAAISTYLRWRKLYDSRISQTKNLEGSSAPLRVERLHKVA